MTDAPRKPFWKRKRWIAAAVLWLVIWYPLSAGPAVYLFVSTGRSIPTWVLTLYGPVSACNQLPVVGPYFQRYMGYWIELARQHRDSH